SRLHRCIAEVNGSLEAYRFDEAANALYRFIWHEYCDWYLESTKQALLTKESEEAAITRTTLVDTFETILRLLHPFMPFITEEIWHALPHDGESIMVASYPSPNTSFIDQAVEDEIKIPMEVATGIREIRGTQSVPPSKQLPLVSLATQTTATADTLLKHEVNLTRLTRVQRLE